MTTDEVLNELVHPGRKLLFIDDSGTSDKPLVGLVKDFMLLAGVLIRSENYSQIIKEIREHIQRASEPLSELHTTEILNPSKKSPWRKLSNEYRVESLQLLGSLIHKYALALPYMYIGAKQYREILFKSKVKKRSQKKGLKQAYYYAVVKSCWFSDGLPFAILYDSEENLKERLKIINVKNNNMLCNGYIEASSSQVIGIQLADYAAYSLNRMFHIKDRVIIKDRRIHEYDRIIYSCYEKNRAKYYDLLSIE